MATDIRAIVANLLAFYDFAERTVVSVGAGGGQLIDYARPARRVIAVDKDEAAIGRLAKRIGECGLDDRFTLVEGDFLAVGPRGDVVLFEFCLHEMAEPERALGHAAGLAPDVLVIDHAPASRWMWFAAEEDGVRAAWRAIELGSIRRRQDFNAIQRFRDYPELEAKLASQDAKSLKRIARFRGQSAISIPMPYRLALI